MKEYKVWVEIEEYDSETGRYQDVGEPVDIGLFKTFLTGGAEPETEKPMATEDAGTDEAKTTSKRRK